jgi:antibiotic biosynthesis monooxygenase (ABM) superfamily enzyme
MQKAQYSVCVCVCVILCYFLLPLRNLMMRLINMVTKAGA